MTAISQIQIAGRIERCIPGIGAGRLAGKTKGRLKDIFQTAFFRLQTAAIRLVGVTRCFHFVAVWVGEGKEGFAAFLMPFRTFAEQACVGSIAFAGSCNRRFQYGLLVIQIQFDAVGAQAADVYGQAVFAVERSIDAALLLMGMTMVVIMAVRMTVVVTAMTGSLVRYGAGSEGQRGNDGQ